MPSTVYQLVPKLESFYREKGNRLPRTLAVAVNSLGEEEVPFAGDELAALAEELIRAISGFVIASYLEGDTDNEELNLRLVELFMGARKITPGGLLALARDLGAYLESGKTGPDAGFYLKIINDDNIGDRHGILSQGLDFRNTLMHGTFLAPAQKLENITNSLWTVLERLAHETAPALAVKDGVPRAGTLGLFPLYTATDGAVDLASDWKLANLPGEETIEEIIRKQEAAWTGFADLFLEYLDETRGTFLESENAEAVKIAGTLPDEVRKKLDGDAMSLGIVTWWNTQSQPLWGAVTRYLSEKDNTTVLSWRMGEGTIRYYGDVMLGAVEQVLIQSGIKKSQDEKTRKFLDKKLGEYTGKHDLVVVVEGFHHRMNRDVHLRHSLNLLAERKVRFVGIGFGYPDLDQYFTDRVEAFTGAGDVPGPAELVGLWARDGELDEQGIKRVAAAAGKIWELAGDSSVMETPGFRQEETLSLRRLHDSGPAGLDEFTSLEIGYAAAALAPVLRFGRQEAWLEYNPRGGLEDTRVEFYRDFRDLQDISTFDPEKRLYRMFRESVFPDRKQTEVDLVYDTMGRDDLLLEYRPVAISRIGGGAK